MGICWENILEYTTKTMMGIQVNHHKYCLVGGFNPSEKYERQLGLLFPIIWKKKRFQTTNQMLIGYASYALLGCTASFIGNAFNPCQPANCHGWRYSAWLRRNQCALSPCVRRLPPWKNAPFLPPVVHWSNGHSGIPEWKGWWFMMVVYTHRIHVWYIC